jgi:hypothetical protein
MSRKGLVAVSTALLMFLPLVFQGGPVLAGAPKLVLDVTSHDFGEVDETEPVQYTFNLSNQGDEPLKISNVESS